VMRTVPISEKQQDGPTISFPQRVEKLTPDRDNPYLVVSEILLVFVLGTSFVLIQVSRRRASKPSPDTRLAKLLHTRPWR